jgi:hypothetical protein
MPSHIRPLHWVFKIANRNATMNFYLNVLKMKVLRHEEFKDECKAYCNGPYDGKRDELKNFKFNLIIIKNENIKVNGQRQ